jgi:putative ABC transport system permease protein
VLETKGVQLGVDLDDLVVVPVQTAMKMFDRSSLFRILINMRRLADLDLAKERIVALMTERHGEEDITCMTQDAVLSTFSQILGALTLAIVAIAAISLSVAGIGIMNVTLVSVSERTAEIGLLKALGARGRQILGVFLAESALLASAGGAVGLLLGAVVVHALVAAYPELPAQPPVWAVVAAFLTSLVVGLVFGVLPAKKATELDPALALSKR